MAATVQIVRRTDATGATHSDITSINTRAGTYDEHTTAGTTYPIQIPAAGTNYSYWVNTQLKCTVTPSGTIDNLRWYTDGANNFGTGVTMKVSKATDGDYVQATGTPGETGTLLNQTNYATLDDAPVDAFGKTSGSPYALVGSISNPSTGVFGDLVVFQIEVDNTASPGELPVDETCYFKYDET